MKAKLLVFLAVIILAGCTSIPVPTPQQNTLLAGKLIVNWVPTDKAWTKNESVKSGIKVYFKDEDTGKITLVITQKEGWLLTNKLNGSNYSIQKFFIEIKQGNTIYSMTLNGPSNITLENGAVNNIGIIQIDIENNKYSLKRIDYDTVKLDFQANFSDSEWNSYDWKNINIFANIK